MAPHTLTVLSRRLYRVSTQVTACAIIISRASRPALERMTDIVHDISFRGGFPKCPIRIRTKTSLPSHAMIERIPSVLRLLLALNLILPMWRSISSCTTIKSLPGARSAAPKMSRSVHGHQWTSAA